MNLEEAIKYANNMTKTKYHHGMVQMGNLNDDEYGFGFYQEIYAARSFGYVDTEFKTVEELNLAPVVAWKAIEEFESEEEDADINRK